MSVVICDPCVGCVDTACVDVCPVDCIHGPVPLDDIRAIPRAERGARLPGIQMFINPKECICCNACLPQCPVQAILDESDVPDIWHAAIARNERFFAPA